MITKLKYFTTRQAKRRLPQNGTTRTQGTLKQRVKANARYITHRRGKDGEKMSRELFGHDGKLDKAQVYEMIDQAPKNTYFYKLVISPSPKRRDNEDWDKALNMRQLTLETIAEFEQTIGQQVQFFAAIHVDHRPHRHIHATILVQGRLSKDVFSALPGNLRQAALEEALSQREQLERERGYERHIQPLPHDAQLRPDRGGVGYRPSRMRLTDNKTCPVCDGSLPWHEAHCPFGVQLGREVRLQL